MKTTAKLILKDILTTNIFRNLNIDKVYRLSGIKGKLYNGKRSNDKQSNILLRAINEQKAKEIVNQMPFPYIQCYKGRECLREHINKMHRIE
jgi:hypothetical protein